MNENPKFQELKAKHPDWSDEQIWTAISLDMEADRVIEQKGADVNPDDPTIITEVINGAREWLKEILPQIFEKVKEFFSNLLANLKEWLMDGLKSLIEKIPYLISTITRR